MSGVVSGLLSSTRRVQVSSSVGCGQVCAVVCWLVWVFSCIIVSGGVHWCLLVLFYFVLFSV